MNTLGSLSGLSSRGLLPKDDSPLPSFFGIWAALPTPYRSDFSIDECAFQSHLRWLVQQQSLQGVVPGGSTGESMALSHEERVRLTYLALDVCEQHTGVLANIGTSSAYETIVLAKKMPSQNLQGFLVMTPLGTAPPQEGLKKYYKDIHDATNLPLVLYNNPARTGVDLNLATIQELATLPRVVAIKEASCDLSRPFSLWQSLKKPFGLLSGEDATFFPFLTQGGHGIISVSANCAPHLLHKAYQAWQQQDWEACLQGQRNLYLLNQALFSGPNPTGVKYALAHLGFGHERTRLPLPQWSPCQRDALCRALHHPHLHGKSLHPGTAPNNTTNKKPPAFSPLHHPYNPVLMKTSHEKNPGPQ